MKFTKGVGIGLTILGAIVSIVESVIEDKKMDKLIDAKLDERGVGTEKDEES